MTNEERDIQCKLRALQHAKKIGNARKARWQFEVGRSSFYRCGMSPLLKRPTENLNRLDFPGN
jgi:hypothetical protein